MQYLYIESAYNFAKYFLETKNEELEQLANHLKVSIFNLERYKSINQIGQYHQKWVDG